MSRRQLLSAAALALAALLALAWLWLSGARPDAAFTVLGRAVTLSGERAPRPLAADGGIGDGVVLSNAFVAPDEALGAPDAYFWSGIAWGDEGQRITRAARFEPGPWVEVEQHLLARTVRDGFGATFVRYEVDLRGALSTDASQWLLSIDVGGSYDGRPNFHVQPRATFDASTGRLSLLLDERFGDDTLRYAVTFAIAPGGGVRVVGR